jgi:hypothetical protein
VLQWIKGENNEENQNHVALDRFRDDLWTLHLSQRRIPSINAHLLAIPPNSTTDGHRLQLGAGFRTAANRQVRHLHVLKEDWMLPKGKADSAMTRTTSHSTKNQTRDF